MEPARKPKRPVPVSLHPITPDEAVSDFLKIKPPHRLVTKGGKPRKGYKKK